MRPQSIRFHTLILLIMSGLLSSNTAYGASASATGFEDDFRTQDHIAGAQNVEGLRVFHPLASEPDVKINNDGKEIAGKFPHGVRLANGDLLVSFSTSHGTYGSTRCYLVRSTDGGKTWSKPLKMGGNEPGIGYGARTLAVDQDGTIYAGCRAADSHQHEADSGKLVYSTDMMVSRDNGYTWEGPIRTSDKEFFRNHPDICMSNGEVLFSAQATSDDPWRMPNELRGAGTKAVSILRRDKSGYSFEDFVHPWLGPSDEWFITETTPGNLVAIMRMQGFSEFYGISFSEDYGRDWTPWQRSNIWLSTQPSRPFITSDGRGLALVSYGERANDRLLLIPSLDGGKTWDVRHKINVIENQKLLSGDFSYPVVIPVAGHRWLYVYYAGSNIYGNFVDTRFFRDCQHGMMLDTIGRTRLPSTRAHWRFEEDEGNIAHDWAGCNYARLHGPQRVPGRLGRGLRFDGKDDYVWVTDSHDLRVPNEYSIDLWFKAENPNPAQVLLAKGEGPAYQIGLRDGHVEFHRRGTTLQSRGKVEPGKWTHLTLMIVVSGANYVRCMMYLDGRFDSAQRVGAETLPYLEGLSRSDLRVVHGPLFQSSRVGEDRPQDALLIGKSAKNNKFFHGEIDEIGIHAAPIEPVMISDVPARPRRMSPPAVAERFARRYRSQGQFVSTLISLPEGAAWNRFEVDKDTPPGTEVEFDILDEAGKVVKQNISSGASLSGLKAKHVRMQARLTSRNGDQSPVVRRWAVSWK